MAKPAVSARNNYNAGGGNSGATNNMTSNPNSNPSSGNNTNSNSTPLNARPNSSQGNFFNSARQDSIGTLLNNYTYPNFPNNPNMNQFNQAAIPQTQPPTQPQAQQVQQNTFPNYYPKESSNPDVRPRGDSIYLPPPVNSQFRFSGSEDPAGSGQSQQAAQQQLPNLPSRSNSIFNSLIQFPSNHNSVSEGKKPRQLSVNENNSNQISLQDFENYLNSNGSNKESLSNLLAWQQNQPTANQSRSSSIDRKNSKSSKNSSIDLSNPALWESLNYVNGGSISNGSLSNLLQGLSNGSIDFSNMSSEKRRDSILKFLNDQNNSNPPGPSGNLTAKQGARNSDSTQTTLREDIFDNRLNNHNNNLAVNNSGHHPQNHSAGHLGDRKTRSDITKPDGPLSPTSSLSSKSEVKYDVPQSPKTSPDFSSANSNKTPSVGAQINQNMSQLAQAPLQQQSVPGQQGVAGQRYYNFQGPPSNSGQYNYANAPQPNNPGSNQYNNLGMYLRNPSVSRLSQSYQNPQYIPPSYTNFSPQAQQPQGSPSATQFQPPQSYPAPQSQVQQQQQQATSSQSSGGERRRSGRRSKSSQPARNKAKLKTEGDELPPPVQSNEGEKPKLGATKIDQLMLVIQARDKDNQDVKIRTAPDGSIIGDVKPQNLVGGVEKHKLEEALEADEELDEDGRRRKRKKLPQCPYCQKYFGQTTQLEVHIRSHIGYKPFECSYCHKRFTQGGNLTTHLRLHTGEKPFTCEICNKSFSRKGNLAAHKLTHDNLKPYDCKLDNCDKSFTQLGNLKSHQNKFHLNTLNELTTKLAELSKEQINELPGHEQELLHYFKELYKNSNKGIKGRGKREDSEANNSKQTNTNSSGSGNRAGGGGAGSQYDANGVSYDNYGSSFINSNSFRNDSYDLNYNA